MNPRAVLFDVDGTLVDSNEAHARSWTDVLAAFGHPVELARVRRMIGMGGDKIVSALTELDPDSPPGKQLLAMRTARFFDAYFPTVRPIPGGRALFQRLRGDAIRTAVATSAKPDELSALLKRAEVDDLIDEQASSGDAGESKPDPDIVQAALARLGLPPTEVMMIGDTPFDAESSRRAGVPFIAVRSGGWAAEDFAPARAVFQDVGELLSRYATLFS